MKIVVIQGPNLSMLGVRETNIYGPAKLEDIHADGAHDYLKYLKFGYGRGTDDASNEIRHGRMTREEGIAMVKKYDSVRPSDLDIWLRFVGMSEEELWEGVVAAYNKHYKGDKDPIEVAILTMRLVNMHQLNEKGELVLWQPKTS